MTSPLSALIRHMPMAQPLAKTWTFYASAQAADIIVDADPGWSLPDIVTWATAHMLLAVMTSQVLVAASSGTAGAESSSGLQRLQLALAALVISLLLGLVLMEQPTILLPALGLALACRGDTASAPREDRV